MKTDRCQICSELFVSCSERGTTLVGYTRFNLPTPDCDHDDNCRTRVYECKNGHKTVLSIVNKCNHCDWTGKQYCFCSQKVEEWPKMGAVNE
jgi:hypothetical protein